MSGKEKLDWYTSAVLETGSELTYSIYPYILYIWVNYNISLT